MHKILMLSFIYRRIMLASCSYFANEQFFWIKTLRSPKFQDETTLPNGLVNRNELLLYCVLLVQLLVIE